MSTYLWYESTKDKDDYKQGRQQTNAHSSAVVKHDIPEVTEQRHH